MTLASCYHHNSPCHSAATKLHACNCPPEAGVISSVVGARAQVRSFAKENASCQRYGVAQQQVLGWGLKSAHASGARSTLCSLEMRLVPLECLRCCAACGRELLCLTGAA